MISVRKRIGLGLLILALVLAVASPASADSSTYDSRSNITINIPVYVNPFIASTLWSLGTSSLTFGTQEAAHQWAADHGAGISHSYIVVMVNGRAILFVDPPRYMASGSCC